MKNITPGMVTLDCGEKHHKILSDTLCNFLQSKHGVDSDVQWGTRKIRVHRLILDVFLSAEKLLETVAGQQSQKDGIVLDLLLKFLYEGKVDVPKNKLTNLLHIARKSNFKLLVDTVKCLNKNEKSKVEQNRYNKLDSTDSSMESGSTDSSTESSDSSEIVTHVAPWKLQFDQIELDPDFDDTTEIALGNAGIQSDNDDVQMGLQQLREDKPQPFSGMVDGVEQPTLAPTGSPPVHKCGKCSLTFASRYFWRLHKSQTHPKAENHKCLTCGRVFQQLRAFQQHAIKHETETRPGKREKRQQCGLCGKAYINNYQLRVHQRIHTGERPFICEQCGKSFTTAQGLKVHHFGAHSGLKPLECSYCHKRFAKRHVLRQHVLTHSDEKLFICDQCGKGFNKKFNLEKHKQTHAEVSIKQKLATCQICQKNYRDKHTLAYHVRHTHGGVERPGHTGDESGGIVHRCTVCNKEFKTSRLHGIHMHMHKVGKRHACNVCSKAFFCKTHLEIHQRIHTGAKPYKCQVCQRDFRVLGQLQRHQLVHTGEKPYHCDLCQRSFVSSENMKTHKRTIHSSDRIVFNCDVCQKSFPRPDKLRRHALTHTSAD